MNCIIEASFLKDLKAIDKQHHDRIRQALLKIDQAQTLWDIPGVKALINATNAYRIRVGEYRIGIFHDLADSDATVLVVRVSHRKDFYDIFP